MSGVNVPDSGGQSDGPGAIRSRKGGFILLISLCAALSLATGIAVSTLASAEPVMERGEKVDDTSVDIVFTHDAPLDSTTIGPDEFFLSEGTVVSTTVRGNETETRVRLHLDGPVESDELTVGVASTTAIQTVEGDRLDVDTRQTITVEGMDGVAPSLRATDIPDRTNDTATVGYFFDEPIENLSVSIAGPIDRSLDVRDFRWENPHQYWADLNLSHDGNYTVTLETATDEAGNTAQFDRSTRVTVDSEPPNVSATVDGEASVGNTVVFESTGETDAAETFYWDFGNGYNQTGERVSHTYHPGVYPVTMTATDELGNQARETLIVNLSDPDEKLRIGVDEWPERPSVAISNPGPAIPTDTVATIVGTPANQTVSITPPIETTVLASGDDFSLDAIDVQTTTNTSVGIGIELAGLDDPPLSTLESATDYRPVGGFHAQPSVHNAIVDSVTYAFSVESERLEDLGVDPPDVGLFRYDSGEWVELPTTLHGETAIQYEFQADSPGFSSYAAGVDTDGIDGPSDDEDSQAADRNETEEADETTAETDEEDGTPPDEVDDGVDDGEKDDSAEGDHEDDDAADDEAADDEAADDDEVDGNDTDAEDVDPNEDEQATEAEDDRTDTTADNVTPLIEDDVDDAMGDTDADASEDGDESGSILGAIVGLFTTIAVYLGLPLLVVFGALKAVAYYLGY